MIDSIVIAILAGLIFSLPVWRVHRVVIQGSKFIPESKILGLARIPVEENIFLLDIDDIRRRFSDTVQIKSVKISRRLPDTLVIKITERVPFAVVMLGNTPALVDEDGYILAKQSLASSIYRIEVVKFPVLRGIDKRSLEKGVRLGLAERSFMKESISLLSRFIDPSLIQIELGRKDDIIIYLEDVLRVRLGESVDIERKIKVLSALITASKDKLDRIQYVDVRVPDSPVIKFK